MKKKIHWGKLTDTDLESDCNQIKVTGEKSDKRLKVKVMDENGNEVKKYRNIKTDTNKISIIMEFQWEIIDYQSSNEDNIEYIMKRGDDSWKVLGEERNIIVLKANKFNKVWKEMHGNLLKKKFTNLLDLRVEIDDTDMEYRISDDEENNFQINIFRKGENGSRTFSWQKLQIAPKYFLNAEISPANIVKVKYREINETPSQTKIWIISFITVLILAVVSLVCFWKKIWNWIKGESKQEKKIREQLDIF